MAQRQIADLVFNVTKTWSKGPTVESAHFAGCLLHYSLLIKIDAIIVAGSGILAIGGRHSTIGHVVYPTLYQGSIHLLCNISPKCGLDLATLRTKGSLVIHRMAMCTIMPSVQLTEASMEEDKIHISHGLVHILHTGFAISTSNRNCTQ